MNRKASVKFIPIWLELSLISPMIQPLNIDSKPRLNSVKIFEKPKMIQNKPDRLTEKSNLQQLKGKTISYGSTQMIYQMILTRSNLTLSLSRSVRAQFYHLRAPWLAIRDFSMSKDLEETYATLFGWSNRFCFGPSHFIFEINVGKSRIRHRTALKLNFLIDSKLIENNVIQIQSRSTSDPTLSDFAFKIK